VHPILASRRHLALYLMAWLPVVALLTAAMVMTDWGDWVQSLLFTFPMVVVYSFLCLSAWYPCRAMPLGNERAEMALVAHLAAAALSALLWVGMAWVLAAGFERSTLYAGKAGLTTEHTGIIFIAGLLLYLLSVAIHYLFAAAEASRAAERRALEAEVVHPARRLPPRHPQERIGSATTRGGAGAGAPIPAGGVGALR
jgi:hypothetical protein